MRTSRAALVLFVAGVLLFPAVASAQHDMSAMNAGPLPTAPGNAAFATIAEVVRILEADPATDWSKVNFEALRQHLIDMDAVTMRAVVSQHAIPDGIQADVTGTGATAAAIKRVLTMHAAMLDQLPDYHAVATPLGNGVRLTVTAKTPGDTQLVARIRGLGFAGLLTEGDHHAAHHVALARGDANPHR